MPSVKIIACKCLIINAHIYHRTIRNCGKEKPSSTVFKYDWINNVYFAIFIDYHSHNINWIVTTGLRE